MTIQKHELPVKAKRTFKDQAFFWKGIPVAITPQLAESYECEEQNITRNFNRNKEKFKIKKDFFRLTGNQVLDFVRLSPGDFAENTTVLYLWTKRGAMIHAKMLTTPKRGKYFWRYC